MALIKSGADVNAARDDGSTPLAWAASRDDAEIVSALLAARANVNAADENGETPLLLACGNGDLAIARMLLDAKANPNATRWSGDTPLLMAVSAGNLRAGQAPARPRRASGYRGVAHGPDALDVGRRRGPPAHGQPPRLSAEPTSMRFRATATARSCLQPSAATLSARKALLDAKADPLFKAKDGSTVFLIALARGSEPFARLMLDHGADINVRDAAGNTPLHLAVQQGKIELMKELVARGADVNAKTQGRGGRGGAGAPGGRGGGGGLTPFLEAAQTGNVAMLKELIALGADPKAKGPDGSGGVMMATQSRKPEAVKMMVELGLDVNDGPKGRGSPLHTAVRNGSNDIVQYLADHGADFDAKDQLRPQSSRRSALRSPQADHRADAKAHRRARREKVVAHALVRAASPLLATPSGTGFRRARGPGST